MKKEPLRRTIQPEVRVLDAQKGIVEYLASDETVDCYREVIRAAGWRFDYMEKNAPFVDSHNYCTIENLVGAVLDFRVVGKKLVETVQWAIDVVDNKLAQLGWKMTAGGYLKAVSVGFEPVKMASKWDANNSAYAAELAKDKLTDQNGPRCYYIEQQQLELSACIIGANPNAVLQMAKGRIDGALSDEDIKFLSEKLAEREHAGTADDPGIAVAARSQAREEFLRKLDAAIRRI